MAIAEPGTLRTRLVPGHARGHRRRHPVARLAGADRRRPRAASRALARRPRLFPGSACAWAAGWRRLSRRRLRRSPPRSAIPGPSRPFTIICTRPTSGSPRTGMFQVALVDLRAGSPHLRARNTLYVGALRPWQILIPPGVGHGYKVIGKDAGHAGLRDGPLLQSAGRRPHRLQRPRDRYDWETSINEDSWLPAAPDSSARRLSACSSADGATSNVVNLDKLTYAGNLENLAPVADNPRYRFVRGDICDARAGERAACGRTARRHRSFRGRIARGPQHSVARSRCSKPICAAPSRCSRRRGRTKYRRFRACLDRRGVRQPGAPLEADENYPLQPSSPYSASKAGSDLLALSYFTTYECRWWSRAPPTTTGPTSFPRS